MELTDEQWDDVGYAMSSMYRTAAMLALQTRPMMPAQVASEKNIHTTHAAAAMRELRARGLVELRVSEEKHKNKIQALTDGGKTVAEALETVADGGNHGD